MSDAADRSRGGFLDGVASWQVASALVLVAIAVYAGTLDAGFPLDDEIQVQNNVYIRNPAGMLGIFARETWPGYVYRPLPTFTYALTYALVGPSPWLYHLTSVLLHAAVAALAYFCLRRVLDGTVAAVGALLFAVHPVHVEAVASIANRTELLVAVLGLAGLLAVVPAPGARPSSRGDTTLRIVVGTLCFLGALLSKESAATMFLLLPLLVATQRDGVLARHAIATRSFWTDLVRGCWPGAVALGLATSAYFVARSRVLTRLLADSVIAPIDNWLVTLPPLERAWRAFALLGRYVGTAIAPRGLSADYSSATAGMARDLTSPEALLHLALAAGVVLALAIGLWRRSRFWAFVGGWFLASFAITSNVAFPIGVVFADRLAYLPSLAICALLAWALLRLSSAPVRRFAIAGVVLLFAGLTASYGEVWHDNRTLLLYELRTSPESAWVHAGLGNELLRAGAHGPARHHFHEALRIHPTHMHAAHGLALIELAEGDQVEGRAWLERALAFDPGFAPSLNALGFLELDAGKPNHAGELFVRALNADNGSDQARVGLVAATLRTGNLAQAAVLRDELMALDASRTDLRELSAEIDRQRAAATAGVAIAGRPG